MQNKYVYVRTRSQFGKQCIFDDSNAIAEENVYPDPQLMKDYIHINQVDRGAQIGKEWSAYEVQTENVVMKESGMHHIEGGWPKEVNSRDEEAIARYRRRIEKEDNWAPKIRSLVEPMERSILQNNAINIYEHYFNDVVPQKITSPSVRTVNIYKDLQNTVRPITHLSWSSDNGKQLAAAYCSVDFSKVSNNLSPYSYIWDIENPNKTLVALKGSHASVTIEFHPRDPSMLISGLISGQVCNWDIRSGNSPIMISHPRFSHKYPANCALWINSKTNSEFFSASTEGTIYWWDIRMLQKPVESLIMDLENPMEAHVVRATGVSALQYETTMGTKFMAGLENGLLINATRKSKNTAEKIAVRIECHYGPIIAIDRNPFSLKNFLTVGDWTTKIWAEDTREGNLIAIRHHKSILTGGCWSKSRYSVFYVIDNEGKLAIFDILLGVKTPIITTYLCEDSLKAIAPHVDGKLVAIGSERGKIYLVESSDALTTNSQNDRALMTMFFEQCSRYEKAVDNRIKENRLAQRIVYQESESSMASPHVIVKSKGIPRKPTDKDKKTEDKKKPEKERRKTRQKINKDIWELLGDSELADVERQFFEIIEKEMEKYADAAAMRREILEESVSMMSIKETSTKRGKVDNSKIDKDAVKKRDSQKERTLKGSPDKDRSRRSSKTMDIVIVKQKREITTHKKNDDGKIIDGTETIEKKETIGQGLIDVSKRHKSISEEDNKILNKYDEMKKHPKQKMKTISHNFIDERIDEEKLCDDEICMPKICCHDQTGSLIHSEKEEELDDQPKEFKERRMTVLIEEMITGLPKNTLSVHLGHIPQYTEMEKKMILEKNCAPPTLLNETLTKVKKEMLDLRKKMVNPHHFIDLEQSNQTSIIINEEKESEDKLKVISKALLGNSSTAKNLQSTVKKTLELNKKIIVSKNSDKKSKPDVGDCEPDAVRFGSKQILDVIGAKTNLSRLPNRNFEAKPKIFLKKKKELSSTFSSKHQ